MAPQGSDAAGGHAHSSILQHELDFLRLRYQELMNEKTRLEAQYQRDYKKWKEFKAWIVAESKLPLSYPYNIPTPQSMLKTSNKRKRAQILESDPGLPALAVPQ